MTLPGAPESPRMRLDSRKDLGLFIIALVVAGIVALYALDIRTPFNPPYVQLVLAIVVLGAIPLYIAYIAFTSVRYSGSVGIALIGAGVVLIGLSNVGSALLASFPDPLNLVVTVYNIGICVSALLQLAGIVTILSGLTVRWSGGRTLKVALLYGGVVLLFTALVLAALQGVLPPFYVQGTGYTALREVVLLGAIESFALASALFFIVYVRRNEDFFFWYGAGLALMAVGLVGGYVVVVLGSPLSWLVRIAQYVGALFLLIAFLALREEATRGSVSMQEMLERYISEPEDWYRRVVETAGEGIIIARPDGPYTFVNQRMADLLGYPADELVGKTSLDFTFDDWGPVEQQARNALGKGVPVQGEFKFRRRDGSAVWTLGNATPLFDDQGRHVGNLAMHTDITKRKRAEEALQRSNEELQRFAYVASHDLQEPLRSIVSFSQLLERRYKGRLDQDADDYIAFIVEGGVRLQTLIQDLLQVSRVETGAKPLAPTDAGEVVNGALRLLETTIRETGAAVTVGPMPRVIADAAQLEQVFTNLVGNAIKYRRSDVPLEIAISARRVGPMVEFAVADNGIGIEEQYFDRVFEMFRRLHTHDEYEGTGIGLAVVKRIVDRHGGTVRVESTPGEGSTFFFTLPPV